MKFCNAGAEIYVPDGLEDVLALDRVTHLAIGAHQDDIEMLAYHGILQCFDSDNEWFAGVICTNGEGSPRSGPYAGYSDEDMQKLRRQEQRMAAGIGRYAAVIQLGYPSSAVKDPKNKLLTDDLGEIFSVCRPVVVYTHNPADKHDTHVAVVAKVIRALRCMPPAKRPKKVFGCEIWRDLDWVLDEHKVALDVSGRENLEAALLGLYDSQIAGGKRYDLASMGRRRANATFFQSHALDKASAVTYALDLTPLIIDDGLSLNEYLAELIDSLVRDISAKLEPFGL